MCERVIFTNCLYYYILLYYFMDEFFSDFFFFSLLVFFFFFFFQAEDGIRDRNVTGVQTCALPISRSPDHLHGRRAGPPSAGQGLAPESPGGAGADLRRDARGRPRRRVVRAGRRGRLKRADRGRGARRRAGVARDDQDRVPLRRRYAGAERRAADP